MEAEIKKKILIIEDDAHIAEGLELNLRMKGYEVQLAADGVSGLQCWKESQPDLIILDIMLPGIDGISVLRSIRLGDEQVPILILSAKGASDDKIKGLSYGVDDYLAKPFNLEEFLLRVERLLLRRSWNKGDDDGPSIVPAKFTFGTNRIDFEMSKAKGRKGPIDLTEQELKLLKVFVANQGLPLTRARLLNIGWGYTGTTTTRTVDNFIVRFRKYFEENPKKPVHFVSLRSVGYVFVPEPDG